MLIYQTTADPVAYTCLPAPRFIHIQQITHIMRIIVPILLGVGNASVRRLIIDGKVADKNEFPFAVALMDCLGDVREPLWTRCSFHCSGALVAPNAVVTAGHCLISGGGVPGGFEPPRAIRGELYVMAGTNDYTDFDGATLVKVSSSVNKGFCANIRFPGDNDLGIVFLESCVPLTDGVIETIPIATGDAGTTCGDTLTVLGFGRDSNAASILGLAGGTTLRQTKQSVHSHATCNQLYVDMQMERIDPVLAREDEIVRALADTILPEQTMCTSGNGHICFGDSGGPGFVTKPDGSKVLVSVTSFGDPGSDNFCGLEVPFSTKLAGSAAWIRDQLSMHRGCSYVPDSFDAWPLGERDVVSAKTRRTRCRTNEWQCLSGSCIDESLVCDRTTQCADGSDEFLCPPDDIEYVTRIRRDAVDTAHAKGVAIPSAAASWTVRERLARRRYGHKLVKEVVPVVAETTTTTGKSTVSTRKTTTTTTTQRLRTIRPWVYLRYGQQRKQARSITGDDDSPMRASLSDTDTHPWLARMSCSALSQGIQEHSEALHRTPVITDWGDYGITELHPGCMELIRRCPASAVGSLCRRVLSFVELSRAHIEFSTKLAIERGNECLLASDPDELSVGNDGTPGAAITERTPSGSIGTPSRMSSTALDSPAIRSSTSTSVTARLTSRAETTTAQATSLTTITSTRVSSNATTITHTASSSSTTSNELTSSPVPTPLLTTSEATATGMQVTSMGHTTATTDPMKNREKLSTVAETHAVKAGIEQTTSAHATSPGTSSRLVTSLPKTTFPTTRRRVTPSSSSVRILTSPFTTEPVTTKSDKVTSASAAIAVNTAGHTTPRMRKTVGTTRTRMIPGTSTSEKVVHQKTLTALTSTALATLKKLLSTPQTPRSDSSSSELVSTMSETDPFTIHIKTSTTAANLPTVSETAVDDLQTMLQEVRATMNTVPVVETTRSGALSLDDGIVALVSRVWERMGSELQQWDVYTLSGLVAVVLLVLFLCW